MSDEPTPTSHVVLIGPMGAGKSNLGELLAGALGCDFLDSDAWLVERYEETGRVLAARHGLGHLHVLELGGFEAMALHPDPAVIAVAESVADSDVGRRLLREHRTIWIDASPEALLERRTRSDHRRTMSEQEFAELRESRGRVLAACSILRIDTTDASPEESLALLMRAVEGRGNGD